jgi:ribosomal-protein-alanine N-acetyltransferase
MPVLETTRLRLRPFVPADGPDVERYAGRAEVARTLLTMPHPYPEGAATQWIAKHEAQWRSGAELLLAVTTREDAEFLGAFALRIEAEHRLAEAGYWLRDDWWGKGVITEAFRACIAWGFNDLGLHRIFARHMDANPASGAVMRKAGLRHEGVLRQHYWKHGKPHDFHVYGILRDEFGATQ